MRWADKKLNTQMTFFPSFLECTWQYFRDLSSPAVHALGVLHEVRGHLEGKADRIACGDRIHHLILIVLWQKDFITHRRSIKTSILKKDSNIHPPLWCSPHPSQKQLLVLVYTHRCLPDLMRKGKINIYVISGAVLLIIQFCLKCRMENCLVTTAV